MSKIATAAKTYFQMLWRSISSFNYYMNLTKLTRANIIIFFVVSFFLFNFVFSTISFVQLNNNPDAQAQFVQFLETYVASFSAQLQPEASAATAVAELASSSAFGTFVLDNLSLIFLVAYPLLGIVFTLPTIIIETCVIYFAGRFEKRGLGIWTAVAMTVHTTFLVQLLNQIIVSIYPNPIPNILYVLHWVFIIWIVRKYYPLPKEPVLTAGKKASTEKQPKP